VDQSLGGRYRPAPTATGGEIVALPNLTYLTTSSSFDDYRPTMNPAGDTVIFERTPVPAKAARRRCR
jgi:hypothetical protein